MAYKDKERMKEYLRVWRINNPDYYKMWTKNNTAEVAEKRREYIRVKAIEFRKRNPGYRNKYKGSGTSYLDANRHKHYARSAVWRALKSGKLVKPEKCESCGLKTKVEGDHVDYSKRLEVNWLCKSCHIAITNKRKKPVL